MGGVSSASEGSVIYFNKQFVQSRITPATCHAWTDGSLKKSAGFGWLITMDDKGAGPTIAQGPKTLGNRQVAFDAEVAAIEAVVEWYQHQDQFLHMVIHSDSTSAIARMCNSGAGPRQGPKRPGRSRTAGR